MTHRPGPAPATADEIGGGLHVQPPLAIDQLLDTDNEPGHPNERGRTLTTLDHGQGPLLLQTSDICRMARPLAGQVDPNQRARILTPPHASSRRAGILGGPTDASSSGSASRRSCIAMGAAVYTRREPRRPPDGDPVQLGKLVEGCDSTSETLTLVAQLFDGVHRRSDQRGTIVG